MDTNGATTLPAKMPDEALKASATGAPGVTTGTVWQALAKASFAVLGHVNTAGEPRSSGVVYGVADGRLYVVVAPDGWKARQVATGQEVAVTVPVRRGGILSLLAPIPPATISFRARATVHPAGSLDVASVSAELGKLLPDSRRASGCVIELVPEGRFLTYGIGVSLMDMRDPARARGLVAVS